MTCSAAIFDLDGTLLDTLDDLVDSMNAVLARRGFDEHPTAAYRYFVGEGMEMLVRRALPVEAASCGETVAAVFEEMRAQYDRRWADKTRPYDGVPDMLDGLVARGLPMAVLSNKPDDFTAATVTKLLGRWAFREIRGMRPGVPAKPDPTAAVEIAEALETEPSNCLYVGDTATDMKTATAAGMFAAGVTWGFRDRQELMDNGADAIVDRPADLLELLI